LFTALGAVCGLLATRTVLSGAWEQAFGWLGVALVIDGIDGTFARLAHVSTRLPRFSGERLDLVVDYVTYVFVPALALLQGGYLSGAFGVFLAGLILLSSLFHFSDMESKSDDHCFVGFPAIWNIVAFYVFAFQTPPWAVAMLVLACVVLTFVPLRWAHPMRTPLLWPPMASALLFCAAGCGEAVRRHPTPLLPIRARSQSPVAPTVQAARKPLPEAIFRNKGGGDWFNVERAVARSPSAFRASPGGCASSGQRGTA
jgi:phosphatidylcholine synthase